MRFRHACLFLLFLLPGLRALGQAEASARFDSFRVETGEAFELHLKVTAGSEPLSVDFAAWDSLIPPDNRLGETPWTATAVNVWTKDYTLIAFDSASLQLPALVVQFRSGDTTMTNPLQIEIEPTPAPDDLNYMADIKDIQREPLLWSDFWWLYLIAGGIAAGFLLWILWQRRKKIKLVTSRKVELPAHEMALKKLAALEQKQHWQNGRHKVYYEELSHIVREYLEKRFGIPALESTTEETLRGLKKTAFPEALLSGLTELLRVSDWVKFAKGAAPESYHTRAHAFALDLVRNTRPTPPNTPAG